MSSVFKLTGIAAAALLVGTVSASAALIDFTKTLPGVTSGAEYGGWVATSVPIGGPIANEAGPGAVGVLAGVNDGFGVLGDEISYPGQSVTITFTKAVKLVGAYFLDLYKDPTGSGSTEVAHITNGAVAGASDAMKAATALKSGAGKLNRFGYGALEGIALKGMSFTFWADDKNDGAGVPDYALGGISVAPVPLPAGLVLMGTALGGLGLARRKRKA